MIPNRLPSLVISACILALLPILPTSAAKTTSTTSSTSSSSSTNDDALPTVSLDTIEYKIFYANISIGSSPSQDLQLRIDLMQGQSWVQDSRYFISCDDRYDTSATNQSALTHQGVDYEIAAENVCASQGLYNISESETVEYNSDDLDEVESLEMNYIYFEGFMVSDTFELLNTSDTDSDGITLESTDFIVVNYSNVLAGGLGLAALTDSASTESTFLTSCVNNDIINSSAYSLYMGRTLAETMELHLGGVDTSKLQGDFVEFDFIPYLDIEENGDTGSVYNNIPIVPLTGLTVTSTSSGETAILGDSDYVVPAILDSRTYYSYLPYDAIIDFALQLNAYYSADLNRWITDCDYATVDATLDFEFGNLTINVALSEIMYSAYDSDGSQLKFKSNGAYACFLNVLPQEDEGYVLLGTPFLRSIYLSVDNEGKKLAMGQAYVEKYDGDDVTNAEISSMISSYLEAGTSTDSSYTATSSSSSSSSSASKSSSSSKKTTSTKKSSSSSSSTTTKNKKRDASTSASATSSSASDDELILSSSGSASTTITTTSTSKTHWGTTKSAISSGYIPFASANDISSYSTLTLTPSTGTATTRSPSQNVIVSNGEIVVQSSTGGGGSSTSASSTSTSSAGPAGENTSSGSHTSPLSAYTSYNKSMQQMVAIVMYTVLLTLFIST